MPPPAPEERPATWSDRTLGQPRSFGKRVVNLSLMGGRRDSAVRAKQKDPAIAGPFQKILRVLPVVTATVTAAWAAPAGPNTGTRRSPVDRANTSARNPDMTATTTVPAMPAVPPAPTLTAPVGITAPVEARTMPPGVIPAVIPAAEGELSLLHVAGHWGNSESTRGQRSGGASESGCAQRKHSGKNKFLHLTISDVGSFAGFCVAPAYVRTERSRSRAARHVHWQRQISQDCRMRRAHDADASIPAL